MLKVKSHFAKKNYLTVTTFRSNFIM